ncbi:MAG: hypothetical protein KAJ24_03860, partial [Candidatus Aenigmarchaeota archaeon]|nr:hypothetical protein [Candidatus Aenigmarchaeota archaeon]
VLGLSYVAMLVEFSTEKYGTCGTGSLCMHFPRLLGDINDVTSNNKAFEFEDAVKETYNDLVMVEVKRLAGKGLMRLALVSPCKTDLTVKTGICECEEYYRPDRIVYRLDKIACLIDVNKDGEVTKEEDYVPVNLNADGSCPTQITFTKDRTPVAHAIIPAGTYPVITQTYDPHDFGGYDDVDKYYGRFDCIIMDDESVMDALQRCANDKIYDASGNPNHDEYKQCFDGGVKPFGLGCDMTTVAYFKHPIYDATVYDMNAETVNVIPQPLNLKPDILDNDRLAPISGCTDSWVPDIISAPEKKFCIIVSVDTDSMKTYSDGFGSNFCVENEDDANDWIEAGCTVGTFIGSAAIMYFSAGIATPVALFTVGSGGALCSKIVSDNGKWPNDQF